MPERIVMKEVRRLTMTVTRRHLMRVPYLRVRANCPVCGREVDTLDAAQATAVLELTPLEFQRLLTDATIHALPTVSGSLRICQDSLFQPRRS
ncbi:MAG: hypothetical protein HY011_11660 [Acidobacteria bacterium]|nr:hypothetical protein [Acidobacteriota bacterium]